MLKEEDQMVQRNRATLVVLRCLTHC